MSNYIVLFSWFVYLMIGSFLLGFKIAKKEVNYKCNFEFIIIIPLALICLPIDTLWNFLFKHKK